MNLAGIVNRINVYRSSAFIRLPTISLAPKSLASALIILNLYF